MEKIINMFHKPKMAIFFYVMALLCLCYTFYTVYTSYTYIDGLVSAGSITWGNSVGDIFAYFVNNSSNYLFYTLGFIFFGYACSYLNPKQQKVEEVIVSPEIFQEEVIASPEVSEEISIDENESIEEIKE